MERISVSWLADASGPQSVTFLALPGRCRAVVVIDDTTLGPAVGGVRMSSDVTAEEVSRLARAMTLKNAAAMIPYGGGKAGIRIPQPWPAARKETVIRAFAQAIKDLTGYIPGPDLGTDETAMAWIHDEIGRAVGLPAAVGGIPLDEIGATGFGLTMCAEALDRMGYLRLAGARVAIQGFGAVGRHAAMSLRQKQAHIVAVADRSGTVYDPDGLDVAALAAAKQLGRALADTPDAKVLAPDDVLTVACELLIPAAQPDVITAANQDRIAAAIVLPGANIAVTETAETALQERGVLCVPDFIANAGGVIAASIEHRGGDAARAFEAIAERIPTNIAEMLERMRATGQSPRAAAYAMALERLTRARGYRRAFGTPTG